MNERIELTDDELLERVTTLLAAERAGLARLIDYLAEVRGPPAAPCRRVFVDVRFLYAAARPERRGGLPPPDRRAPREKIPRHRRADRKRLDSPVRAGTSPRSP